VTLRQLSPEVRAKVARAETRTANRDRLARIKEALARIEAEIAARLYQKRQASASDREYPEERLLRRVRSARAECDAMEI
jgi:hypothetical protein